MTGHQPSPRHPTARAQGVDLAIAVRRVMATPAVPGLVDARGPQAAVALAAMAVRGRQHRTRAQFAAAYGISEQAVASIEAGHVAPGDVPAPVRHLTPLGSILDSFRPGPWPIGSRPSRRGSAPGRRGR